MISLRVASVVLAGCWTGNAGVAPANKPEPLEQASSPKLLGTEWSGPDVDGEMTFRFRAGGKLNYTNTSGTWDNGRWSQQGNRVLVDMNDHYADYIGTVRGDTMAGKGSNVAGKRWTWSFKRAR